MQILVAVIVAVVFEIDFWSRATDLRAQYYILGLAIGVRQSSCACWVITLSKMTETFHMMSFRRAKNSSEL